MGGKPRAAGFVEVGWDDLATVPEPIRALAPGFEVDRVLYAERSVTIDSLVFEPATCILVDGDLTVRKIIDGRPLNGDPDNARALCVSGDLRAGDALLNCHAAIGGSMLVEGMLIAESDGDFGFDIKGDLRARVIIAPGHHVRVAGKTTGDFRLGFLGLDSTVGKFDDWQSMLVSGLVNEYGGIEIEKIASRVLSRQPVLAKKPTGV